MSHSDTPYAVAFRLFSSAIQTVVLFSALPLYAQEGGPPELPPAPVTTALVQEGGYSQSLRLSGTVESFAPVVLASELEGIVEKLHVEEGDYVTSGAALMSLRQEPLEMQALRADAEARQMKEQYLQLANGNRVEDIEKALASWEEAKVRAEIAKREYDRYGELLKTNAVSSNDFDRIRATYETARASERVTKADYDLMVKGARREVVASAKAAADASGAQAAWEKDRLERSVIRAPFPGVVVAKHVNPGSWVGSGDEVFAFEFTDVMRVSIDVPEIYFNQVSVGDELELTFDAYPKDKFKGRISQKVPRANERSRAFPIKIEVQNTDRRLASGMLARVVLMPREESQKSLMLPKDAVVPMHPKPVVYRVKREGTKATAESISVDTGRFFGEAVEVFSSELKAGEEVVTRGNERLQPGQPLILNAFVPVPGGSSVDPSKFFKDGSSK